MATTGSTGEKVEVAGVYRSSGRCGHRAHEHRFTVGDRFTPCRYCEGSVTWTWIRPL